MKQFKLTFLVVALMMVLVNVGWGQILTFEFSSLAGGEASANSNSNDAGLTTSTITRGAGLTASANGGRFNATSWALTSIANAVTGNDYMEFTITPNSGNQFSVSSIVIQLQRSGTGNTALALRNSVDGYITDLDGVKNVVDNTSTQTFTFTFSQSNSTNAVTYRLYSYAEATGGTGGPGDGTGNDIVVNGTVTSTTSPFIAISSPTISSANVNQGTLNHILMRYDLAVTDANATLNGLTVTTAGSYIESDITNLKVRYSTDNILDAGDATLSTISSPGTAGLQVFPTFTPQTINLGNTGYIFVTTDISSSATQGNTINISTTAFSNISFSGTVNKTGTDPVPAGGSQTFQEIIPQITLNSSDPSVVVGNILQNSTNNIIYTFNLTIDKANATLSGLQITTAGTYIAADFTNFKAWYSSDNSFNPANDILLSTITSVTTAGTQIFPSWVNQVFTNGSTGYAFITADLPCSATYNNTIFVEAITTTDLTFLSGDLIGSAFPSGTQTIQYGDPNNISTPLITSPGTGQATINWTNPLNCFDEIMIVASLSTITGTPAGNGSAYNGSLTFGSGTSFGGGYVVYKGSTTPQTINGLTDGNTYYYKFYTRNGTLWSSGTEIINYLAAPILPGNIYISHLSADYNGASDEFVVLFNNTSSPIDLNGYELKYFSATGSSGSAGYIFNTSIIIQPTKHLLLSPNVLVTVGTVNKTRDLGFTAGLATGGGQLLLRQTSNNSNVIFAVAWGTITGWVAGMNEAAPWPSTTSDGMISLTPNGTTYTYNGGLLDYAFDNTTYSHTLSANITNIPNSGDIPLPISLSTLNSSITGKNSVLINWTTSSEQNNAGFNIERVKSSESGVQNWEKIGFVTGKGTVNTPTNYSYEDRNLQTGKYKYRLKQVDVNGNYEYFELNGEVEIGVPKKFELSQNYPNPFNPVTKINFDLPVDSKVTMMVYDITGREVARLVNNEYKKAGYYTTDFNASSLSSGVYFYSLSADAFRMTKKMVVLK